MKESARYAKIVEWVWITQCSFGLASWIAPWMTKPAGLNL
jgi:hypothetical protein